MVVFTMCRKMYFGGGFYTKTFYSLSEAARFYVMNLKRVVNIKCAHKQRKILRNKIQALIGKARTF